MNTSSIDHLFEHWRKQRYLRLGAALSMVEIAAFSDRHEVDMPADFAAYLKRANGFFRPTDASELSGMDDESFVFHPLDEANLVDANHLIFCTWSIGMVDFALRVDRSGKNGEVIKLADATAGHLLASSFSEFIELYVSNSNSLYRAEKPLRSLDGKTEED